MPRERIAGDASAWNSFRFAPNGGSSVIIERDVNDVWTTADGAIFDVFLLFTGGEIDGNDDLLAARSTDVRAVVTHGVSLASLNGQFKRGILLVGRWGDGEIGWWGD